MLPRPAKALSGIQDDYAALYCHWPQVNSQIFLNVPNFKRGLGHWVSSTQWLSNRPNQKRVKFETSKLKLRLKGSLKNFIKNANLLS